MRRPGHKCSWHVPQGMLPPELGLGGHPWAGLTMMRAWIYFLPWDSTTILRLTQTCQLRRTLMLSQAHCVIWFFEISVLLVLTRKRDNSGNMVSLQQMTVKSSADEGPQTLAAHPSLCPPDYKDLPAIPLNAQCSTVHTDTWILWIWISPFLIGVCLSKTDTIAVILHLGVPDPDPIFGSNNPFSQGSHIRYSAYQAFTLQFIAVEKLLLWSRYESNFMVGGGRCHSMRN